MFILYSFGSKLLFLNLYFKLKQMLTAAGIKKSYGALQVLKGVDVEIKKSEVVTIVGASGAGKSTLLHILGTLDTPDYGTLSINNEKVFLMNASAMARFRNKHIGFVFQFHNLLPEFSALENVMIPGFIQGRGEAELIKRATELLDLLGIKARAAHKPSELSGGEQQRVAVARALVNSPSLILADEPSGNLDSKNAVELHNLFFKLRNDLGQTFVIVTHNNEFAAMADRKIELKDGFVVTGNQ
jgi:lipoprotein-releasing system ATP-binding protein